MAFATVGKPKNFSCSCSNFLGVYKVRMYLLSFSPLVKLPEYDRELFFPRPSRSPTCVQGLCLNKRREGLSGRACEHDFSMRLQ